MAVRYASAAVIKLMIALIREIFRLSIPMQSQEVPKQACAQGISNTLGRIPQQSQTTAIPYTNAQRISVSITAL